MPACARCGKQFSGFSFGSAVPTECRECRRAFPQAIVQQSPNTRVARAGDELLLLGGSPPFVTYAIFAIDVLIFLAVGISGLSWTEPTYLELVRWGADFSPLTLSGEWWRLFTSTFVHIGIIHIALNMWCLWSLGPVLERLMGWKAFLLTYVVCGIAGSEASLVWKPLGGGAGASGAIFGVAGAFFSFLVFKKAPISPEFAKRRLKSVAVFIFYNLFFGAVALRVNNAAHVGGLIAGLILGAVLPCVLRRTGEASSPPDLSQRPLSFGDSTTSRAEDLRLAMVAIIAAVTVVAGAFGLAKHNATIVQYGAAVALIRENDPAAAIPKLQKSIVRDPNNALSLEMLGILRLDQNDPTQAWPVLRRAVDLDPNNLALRHNLALAYIGAGFPEYAPKEIGWALKSEAENKAAANFILGVSSYRVENYTEAERYLRQAIEDRKGFFEAQNVLGVVYSAMGKRTEAHDQYAAVLGEHPRDLVAEGGLQVLTTISKGPVSPDQLPQIVIPYSKLIAKSELWPLFP